MTLKEYRDGLWMLISEAKRSRDFALYIAEISELVNQTDCANAFGFIQLTVSDRDTLHVAKMYDNHPHHPIMSVPGTLNYIRKDLESIDVENRNLLEQVLGELGFHDGPKLSDIDLKRKFCETYESIVPSTEKKDQLSEGLIRVMNDRNKYLAHNEAIPPASRAKPLWDDTEALTTFAMEFVARLSRGFLGVHEVAFVAGSPERNQFKMIVDKSGIIL